MTLMLLVLATLLVAYANGANDNFKGVASLAGSHTTSYRRALIWGTATTFAGDSTRFDSMGRCPAADVGTVLITRGSDQNTIGINRLGRINIT